MKTYYDLCDYIELSDEVDDDGGMWVQIGDGYEDEVSIHINRDNARAIVDHLVKCFNLGNTDWI